MLCSEANKTSDQRTFRPSSVTGRWSYDTLGDTANRTVPEDRTTTPTIPPINRVRRLVDASSALPAAFRQVISTPMRSTEQYASRIAYSDIRLNEATGQPRCRRRRQPVRCDAKAISAALLAPLRFW